MNVIHQAKAVIPRSAAALARVTINNDGPDLKRLWDGVVEHGPGAATLVSPEAAAALNGLAAFTSLGSLIVSFGYALWALRRFIKSTRK